MRDATAYVPKRTLATPAGVDHDYNFISAIERSRERSEGFLVEEKGIIKRGELRPVTVENVEYRYKDGKMRRVLVTRALRKDGDGDGWGEMGGRLRRFGIRAVRAPVGMSRRKENETRWFRRTRRVEWFVEVFLVRRGGGERERVTMKIVDDMRVCEAFLMNRKTRGLGKGAEEQEARIVAAAVKPLSFTFQDENTGTWVPGTTICVQNPRTTQWVDNRAHQERPNTVSADAIEALKGRVSFYLSRPPTTSSAATTLIPFDPEEKLHDVLSGRVVLEYPTIYAVEVGAEIPSGFVVNSTPKIKGEKRKSVGGDGDGSAKRRKLVEELEDGEVLSDVPGPSSRGKVEEDCDESESESSSSSSSSEDESEEGEEVLEEVVLSEAEEESDDGLEDIESDGE